VRTQKTKGVGKKKVKRRKIQTKPNKPSDNNNYCLMHRDTERETQRERER
jgi:hypothetical protein